jgi:cell division protein FtsB
MAVAGLLFFAFLMNEVAGHSGYVARQAQFEQIEALHQQILQLKDDNSNLARRIQDLRSDPRAIEEMAREQLHLGRPGEVVVTLPNPEQPAQP